MRRSWATRSRSWKYVISKRWPPGSGRIYDTVADHFRVEDQRPISEFQLSRLVQYQAIVPGSASQDLRWLVEQGLNYQDVLPHLQFPTRCFDDPQPGIEAPAIAGRIHLRLQNRPHPVGEHSLAVGLHDAQPLPGLVILPRNDAVTTLSREKLRPFLETARVEGVKIRIVERADSVAIERGNRIALQRRH